MDKPKKVKESYNIEDRLTNPIHVNVQVTSLTRAMYIFVALLIVASYLLGTLVTKVQFMGSGVQNQGAADANQPASKYASFEDAIKAIAKEAGADANKIISCMNSGEKKSVIDSDAQYGQTVGVAGTPAFLINGRLLAGAFPFESFKELIDKELAGTGSDNYKDYSETLQKAYEGQAFDPKARVVDIGKSITKGPAQAAVKIVEFSDFQCPYCERAYPTVNQVLKEYDGKVLFAYKHFPLNAIHPRAQKAAEAAECARDQGKFWEFHDKLYENQADWSSI